MSKIDKELHDLVQSVIFKGGSYSEPDPLLLKELEGFIKDKIKEITDEMIGEASPHNDWCNVYDSGVDDYSCDCGVSEYNQKRQEIIKIRDKYLR